MSDTDNYKRRREKTSTDITLEPGLTGLKISRGDLLVEPDESEETREFSGKMELTLDETEEQVRRIGQPVQTPERIKSWERAKTIVADFRPVPWFIWRLSNYALGQSSQINEISEGLVFGLRRLMFAMASDPLLGTGSKVNDVRQAVRVVSPDVVAAVSVIHAICRRMANRPFERIWRPILDDAVLRARIGFQVGGLDPKFGRGRGMLSGFVGRCGLVMLISSGDLEQARQALEMLAAGKPIKDVGLEIYACEPLQISALTLSAAGCGRDAAFGTASYALREMGISGCENLEQARWLASFVINDAVRTGHLENVEEESWVALQFMDEAQRTVLIEDAKRAVRRGHGWSWIV